MKLSVVSCLFVLDTIKGNNVKKNDTKVIKLLVSKKYQQLMENEIKSVCDIKGIIKQSISLAIGSSKFHLEQVYTLSESQFAEAESIDIIYLALTNIENVKALDEKYELIDFSICDNSQIIFGDNQISYKTKELISNGNAEYAHVIDVDDIKFEKELLELIIAYKYLRQRIDGTDICFKLLPEFFSLEDVRLTYELVKDIEVEKSNFRKKIAKFCEKTDMIDDKKGYRPTQMYRFNPENNDIWI